MFSHYAGERVNPLGYTHWFRSRPAPWHCLVQELTLRCDPAVGRGRRGGGGTHQTSH